MRLWIIGRAKRMMLIAIIHQGQKLASVWRRNLLFGEKPSSPTSFTNLIDYVCVTDVLNQTALMQRLFVGHVA